MKLFGSDISVDGVIISHYFIITELKTGKSELGRHECQTAFRRVPERTGFLILSSENITHNGKGEEMS